MKKILLSITALCSITLFAQKTKPILQATFVSTTVNEGTKNHFSDNTVKRDLTFTIDADAKLNGEITLKDATTSNLIFKGLMKDNHLVDSAIWYNNNKVVKVVNFKDKCCTNTTDYVDPTSKVLSSIKGEKHGIERIFYSTKPDVVKTINSYQSGKKHGKCYEYDSMKVLVAVKNYKNGKLNDTSWVNYNRKTPDMEIYADDLPSGVWKKYNASGGLLEVSHKLATGDSTLVYGSDTKLLSIATKSAADNSIYTCKEYNAKMQLTKLYYIKDRVDTNAQVLHGMYEEYINGKISLRGEYWLGTKIETWITYNARGTETNWESFTTRDIAMTTLVEGAPTVATAAAVDLFPPALTKATITMELAFNGKIEKLFKKTQEINWELSVKSSTDHTVTCNDEKLTESERADVVEYLTSCITTVKGVRYSHKEVSFVTKYKLVFK